MYETEYDEQGLTEEERQAAADQAVARQDELMGQDKEEAERRKAIEAARPQAADIAPDQAVGRSAAKSREDLQPEQEEEQPEEEVDTRAKYGVDGLMRYKDAVTGGAKAIAESQAVQTVDELTKATGAGTYDYVRDVVRTFGGSLPEYRKFESEYAQASRELASFIVPNIVLGGAGKALGVAANAKVAWGLGQSKLVQLIGSAGMDIGTGVLVDYTNSLSGEGDNLTGTLKKNLPAQFGWISDNIATVDGDNPDIKRNKSIYEGVGLGMFTAFAEAAGKLAKGSIGKKFITSFQSPEEKASKMFQELNRLAERGDVPEDVFARALMRTEEALDQVGDYIGARATDLDELFSPGIYNDLSIDEAGVRSADPDGVFGASVDAVRIKKNYNTQYGRLGSIITEGAAKYGLEIDNLTKRQVVKMITDRLKAGGKYSAELADGRKIPFEEIDEVGTELAEIMVDPRMDAGMLKGVLDEYKSVINDLGVKGRQEKLLGKAGYNAAMKAIKGYMDEYINMDMQKASAYLTTSMAGQMSDIAEGARIMEGTEAVARAQEMILDRMEYLMVEKGLAAYNWGASLNYLNTWKRFSNNPELLAKAGKNAKEQTDDALKSIISRAKNSANSLRQIAKSRPDFLVPLQMAWEFSDGNIDTLAKLHNYVNESLGTISKAFIDNAPEIPSVIVQGIWSNIYNSVLSAASTFIKAGAGNAVLMLQKPISVFAGAALSGDIKTLKRAAYQYMAVSDTFLKSWKHMGTVFRKASQDPNSVGYIMREEMVYKNEAQMDILHSFAQQASKNGEDGPLVLYNMAETMQDIANHPWMRFGANAMTALDGFTRATLANVEARGRVYDKMMMGGERAMLSADEIKKAEQEVYEGMFDKNGMITDKAVDYASREIALNLDTDQVRSLSAIIRKAPFLKPFLMFPRTADNMLGMVNKFSPISVFIKDYNKLALPGNKFSSDDIVRILTERGLPVDVNMEQTFRTLRAEIRGRKAIGMASVMGAAYMFMGDNLHGNGHYDKERQNVRRKMGWQPRSFRAADGNWYSYDFLGPMADFISVTADIMDNMDTIDQQDGEALLGKMGFVLGANLTNKSFVAGLEPMGDLFTGNPAAVARWGSSFASSLLPLSGARNELGRLMSPALREVNQELWQLFHNRNKFVDVVNPDAGLPIAYDWMDGKPVGYPESFWTRMWNAVMPMKVSEGISPEKQFLIDVEYDSQPTFAKAQGGIQYTPQERSELFELMGKEGYFRREVQRIMRTVDGKKFRAALKEMRETGNIIDERDFANVYYEIDVAMREAKRRAEDQLSNAAEIRQLRYEQSVNDTRVRRGLPPEFPLRNR
jgi:hypothetical protein